MLGTTINAAYTMNPNRIKLNASIGYTPITLHVLYTTLLNFINKHLIKFNTNKNTKMKLIT